MYIDEKFKDQPPAETVKIIEKILKSLGIEVEEHWNNSGVDHCYSLSVNVKNGYPSSNGKGVSKELARASAYAEFIERLQQGLHYYKLQSLVQDNEMNLQIYAPDKKYMTTQELIDNGDWMDYLTDAYGKTLTRKKIAQQCKIFSCAEEDKILTIPYYSIFEDKYVYLPASFVEQVYISNGCCAGNTQEEALVHAISEIFERKCKLDILVNGNPAPKIPDSTLKQYKTITKILDKIRSNEDFDISILDISDGSGFPVVASRIINKSTQDYLVNAAADPVLEIAIQRTLTELFQGKNIEDFHSNHSRLILNKPSDVSLSTNAWNAIECSNGLYTADFFADGGKEQFTPTKFDENSHKNNKELLNYVFNLCKKLRKPVYIRNYSYLGFISYKVIIPGYSEGNWLQLLDPISEYAFANDLRKSMLDIASANNNALISLLMYRKMVAGKVGKINNFSRLAGLPLSGHANFILPSITFAYAAYKLQKYHEAEQYCKNLAGISDLDKKLTQYLSCVAMYINLKSKGIDDAKIKCILFKFFHNHIADQLFSLIDCGKTPFDLHILKCDFTSCRSCKYNSECSYNREKALIKAIGNKYNEFITGQDKENFPSIN